MEIVNLYAIPFRFSQFFVSPLVKAEAMDREVLAVDSGNLNVFDFINNLYLHTN